MDSSLDVIKKAYKICIEPEYFLRLHNVKKHSYQLRLDKLILRIPSRDSFPKRESHTKNIHIDREQVQNHSKTNKRMNIEVECAE